MFWKQRIGMEEILNWIKPLQAFRLHCNLSSIKGVQGSLQTFNGYKAASCTGESRNFDLNFCVREEEYIYLISLRCSLFPLCTFRQLKFCLGVPVRSSHRAFIKAGHFLIISESMIIKLFSGYLSRTLNLPVVLRIRTLHGGHQLISRLAFIHYLFSN